MKVKNYILLSLILLCNEAYAQKIEREYDISNNEAPQKANAFIRHYFKEVEANWYMEESHQGKTIEAKFKFNGSKFSIEFDTIGNLLDIEKQVKFKQLETKNKDLISKALNAVFIKYKIKKTQEQFIGDEKNVAKHISAQDQPKEKDYTLNYELIVKAKEKGKPKAFYEVLISENGEILRVDRIVQRSTDNFEF